MSTNRAAWKLPYGFRNWIRAQYSQAGILGDYEISIERVTDQYGRTVVEFHTTFTRAKSKFIYDLNGGDQWLVKLFQAWNKRMGFKGFAAFGLPAEHA